MKDDKEEIMTAIQGLSNPNTSINWRRYAWHMFDIYTSYMFVYISLYKYITEFDLSLVIYIIHLRESLIYK